jgi:4-hydroxy-4-methyl-2-oxoglutarate aldolase
VHAAMAALAPGDVLVLTMPEPEPVALIGELLATQAKAHGAAALLVDGAVRDVDEMVELGLPIWTRHVCIRGATKDKVGAIGEPVTVGGQPIATGDILVLDADGVAAVPHGRLDDVLAASLERERHEADKRAQLRAGALSYDLDNLRARVEQGA